MSAEQKESALPFQVECSALNTAIIKDDIEEVKRSLEPVKFRAFLFSLHPKQHDELLRNALLSKTNAIFLFLLEKDINPEILSFKSKSFLVGNISLHCSWSAEEKDQALKELAKKNIKLLSSSTQKPKKRLPFKAQYFALRHAIFEADDSKNDVTEIKRLLEQGPKPFLPQLQPQQYAVLLQDAFFCNTSETFLLLLTHGADLLEQFTDHSKILLAENIALHCSWNLEEKKNILKALAKKGTRLPSGHMKVFSPQHLFDNGITAKEILQKDSQDHTPLHYATINGLLEVVQYLVTQKAKIEAKNKAGCTTLMLTAGMGYMEIVTYLFEAEAEIWSKDKQGRRAYDHARNGEHHEVAEYLRRVMNCDVAKLQLLQNLKKTYKTENSDNMRLGFTEAITRFQNDIGALFPSTTSDPTTTSDASSNDSASERDNVDTSLPSVASTQATLFYVSNKNSTSLPSQIASPLPENDNPGTPLPSAAPNPVPVSLHVPNENLTSCSLEIPPALPKNENTSTSVIQSTTPESRNGNDSCSFFIN